MNAFEEQDYTAQFDFGLWKKLLRILKERRKEMISMALLMIPLAFIDSIYPRLTAFAINNFIVGQTVTGLPWFIVIYMAIVVTQVFTIYGFIKNSGRLEAGVVYAIRIRGFRRLQELSFSYYDTTPVGWIMARMTSDAQRVGDVVAWSATDLFWGPSYVIFIIINMFILSPKYALIVLVTFPLLVVASFYFQRIILKNQREVRKINSKITGAYNEGINGARTTKTLIREAKNFEEFQALSGGMRRASIHSASISAVYLPVVLSLGSISAGLVLWLGGADIQKHLMEFGTYSAFIAYATQIFDPIQQIARVISDFQSAQAAAERTMNLIETVPDIVDSPEIVSQYGDGFAPLPENWPVIHGDIEFDNVSFSYKTGERVLKDFSLHIKAGEKIALVGETGSGKSTIVNLICRFYEPTSGQIRIDGVDYKERSQIWLQSNLGYVLQSPHLFSGTVRDNIRYAKLDASDGEIIQAARTVNAYDFIMRLEKGFDSEVGEGGSRLSSGQKQLISFARAIIANPRIFVLDEATSSIDTETEMIIQNAIYSVLEGRTSFIVAHRLSTIRSCDRILVIQKGEVIESGTHRELLRQKGHYYDLYTNQFKEEAENRLLQV